jgi:hypothetical protein
VDGPKGGQYVWNPRRRGEARGLKTRRVLKWKRLDNGVESHAVAMRLASPGRDVVQPRSGGESESLWENNTPLSLVFPTS